jgi:hypothetical protein
MIKHVTFLLLIVHQIRYRFDIYFININYISYESLSLNKNQIISGLYKHKLYIK